MKPFRLHYVQVNSNSVRPSLSSSPPAAAARRRSKSSSPADNEYLVPKHNYNPATYLDLPASQQASPTSNAFVVASITTLGTTVMDPLNK